MKLAVPLEIMAGERRVALVPESIKKLVQAGLSVVVQQGAGYASSIDDAAFIAAGATVEPDASRLYGEADFVVKVQPPMEEPSAGLHETSMMKAGAMLLAILRPTVNPEAVRRLAEARITSLAIDALPRITRAQSMDVLSSQATVAGYKAVLIAANELPKLFPMLMTAAGTIRPARVFIIGAGVAGLQAIATAKRLGATVEATDTRPAVKEQVESLGARFVSVDSTEDAQDARGYAMELSADFYRKQAELIARHCAGADVVITTALIGGVKAPTLITEEMVRGMKPGSVIVDVAAEGGGNCALTQPGATVRLHGVIICGPTNIPSDMAMQSSILYSRNVTAFLLAFWKDGKFHLDFDDEIIKSAAITHEGRILHEPTRKAMQPAGA